MYGIVKILTCCLCTAYLPIYNSSGIRLGKGVIPRDMMDIKTSREVRMLFNFRFIASG
jgi:hypothetical protein